MPAQMKHQSDPTYYLQMQTNYSGDASKYAFQKCQMWDQRTMEHLLEFFEFRTCDPPRFPVL